MSNQRDPITFEANTPVRVTFQYAGGREYPSLYGDRLRTMYSLQGNKVLWAEAELAVKINFVEPQPGDSLWITKHQRWVGTGKKRHRTTEWQVSAGEPGVVQRQNDYPDTQANAQATGIPESDLERELRESREMVQARAANRAQARENVARMPEPPVEPPVERRPPASETQPPPPAPEPLVRPRTQLEAALCTAVDACYRATEYARTLGYPLVFTSEDIEKMAVTLLIEKRDGEQQRRRA